MTRFVTGGAGFIGANYLFYLRGHYPDDRLVCIDKLTYAGDLSTLEPLLGQPNFRFAKVDICDREAVYGLFEEEHPARPAGSAVHRADATAHQLTLQQFQGRGRSAGGGVRAHVRPAGHDLALLE